MDASYIPRVYRIADLAHDIITIQIDASIVTPLWIAFFDHNPRACTTGKDEANAVFTLLKTLALVDGREEKKPEQGAGEQEEQKPAPSPAKETGTFFWTPERIDLLKQDFQEYRQADAKHTIKGIGRAIAAKHGWPLDAIEYKIYHLKLPQQTIEKQAEPEPPHQKAGAKERPAPQITLPSNTTPVLAQGNISWQARVDGMPLTWKLDYTHGNFPFAPNSVVTYRDTLYRIRRAGDMTLDVSSEEADIYAIQAN